MNEQEINIIKKIVKEINEYESIDLDTDLLEIGILDSVAMMVLVNEIENEFDIDIDIDDLITNNFRTIKTIEKIIDIKRNLGEK